MPPSVTVFGDAERLSQLFHNVLENSLRYTDEGGQLRVVGDVDDGRLTLRFFDSAPGVEPYQLPHIFERFYRTEGSRNRASGDRGWVWRFVTTSSTRMAGKSALQIRL
ncbi:hypothetical protein SODG_003996 [Sodalis praecaptivus]